jgi:hypothetical protein
MDGPSVERASRGHVDDGAALAAGGEEGGDGRRGGKNRRVLNHRDTENTENTNPIHFIQSWFFSAP